MTSYRLASYQPPATRYRLRAPGNQLPVTGYRLPKNNRAVTVEQHAVFCKPSDGTT